MSFVWTPLICVLGGFASLGEFASSVAGMRLHQPARRANHSAVPSTTTPEATAIAMIAPTASDAAANATGGVDCDESMSCTTGVAVMERPCGSSAEALVALLRTGARAASTI